MAVKERIERPAQTIKTVVAPLSSDLKVKVATAFQEVVNKIKFAEGAYNPTYKNFCRIAYTMSIKSDSNAKITTRLRTLTSAGSARTESQ